MGFIERFQNKISSPEQISEHPPEDTKVSQEKNGILDIQKDGNVLTIFLGGKINVTNYEEIRDTIMSQIPDMTQLILDASEIIHVSSAGLRIFFEIKKSCLANGTQCEIINASPNLYRMFQMTGYSALINISQRKEEF